MYLQTNTLAQLFDTLCSRDVKKVARAQQGGKEEMLLEHRKKRLLAKLKVFFYFVLLMGHLTVIYCTVSKRMKNKKKKFNYSTSKMIRVN